MTAGVAGAGPAGAARLRAAGTAGAPDALLYLGYLLTLMVTTVFAGVWLFIGAIVAVTAHSAELTARLSTDAAAGSGWAAGLLAAVGKAEPPGQAVLDYGFSLVGLVLAVVLLLRARGSWVHRLLALAMVGSAGAFNLQAHGATVVVEKAIGVAIGQAHQIQLHGVACAAYIMALLLFPTGRWTLTPTGAGTGPLVALPAVGTLLVVGVGTALLPHTVSCILFFGFAVPLVGLAALHRRRAHGRTTDARTQARLLFSVLAGAFGVMIVLALITGVLAVLDQPGLSLVDPTAGAGTPAQPTALLFWFSRAAAVAVAAAALVATRRGGLYSAERLFSRGLASVLLIVLVGGGWIMVKAVFDRLWGPSAWSSVAATMLAALAFLPLYQRVEQLVERLLYGRRPTPYRVLADVAALSGTQAGGPNLAAVAEAIGRALGASACRLTVLRPGLRDRTYGWSAAHMPDAGAREWSGALHELPGAADMLALPIRQGSEEIGAIGVDRGAVVGLQNERRHLLEDVADSLGAILQASRLGIELERQLRAALAHAEEIAVSRRAAVAEMDSERRAIERDLHDGAQHHLVTLRLALGLVEHEVSGGRLDSARRRIAELTEKLSTAEAVLAKTASGVSSIVLAEQGLVSALRADLTGSVLDAAQPVVTVLADSAAELRFPAEVEAAVYFCCLEAVNNSRKHAGGAPVEVSVSLDGRWLRFVVRDSGPGFTPSLSGSAGRGLRNLTSRIAGVGGTLSIESAPGAGTVVHGQVPLAEPPLPVGAPPVGAPPGPGFRAAGPIPMTPLGTTPVPMTPPGPVPIAAAMSAAPAAPPPAAPPPAAPPPAAPPPVAPPPVAPPPAAPPPAGPDVPVRPQRRATFALPAVQADNGSSLRAKVLALAETAVGHGDGQADAAELARLRDRLAAPLQVVVVGPARAGTTTLVNALAEIAPPEVEVIDLSDQDHRADRHVDALVTLLRPGPHGTELARLARIAGVDPLSVAVLAVLNQADEVCGQQPEDWDEALAVAVACQQDPDLQRIGQPVTPVIGRLALGALELTETDVCALRELGDAAEDADAALLDKLGLFGVRHAVSLLRSGVVESRDDLAQELATTSGLIWLAEALRGQFARRAQALRARAAMVEMETLVSRRPETAEPVLYRLEELRAGTHELAEIELADALAGGSMVLLGSDRNAALRLLGTADSRPTARLGLPDDASPEELRTAVTEELSHWRRQAAHPAATSSVRRAAEILVRTCESLLAQTLQSQSPHP